MRIVGDKFFCVCLNFPDAGHDLLHVGFISQQRWLRHPNRLPGRTMGVRKRLAQEGVLGRGLRTAQPLAVFPVTEHIKVVQRWIAGLIRNTLCIHRCNKTFGRNAGKLFAVDVKDVCVLTIASAPCIKLLWSDAGYLAEFAIKPASIPMTLLGLLVQSSKLRHQNSALPFAEPIIRSVAEMAVEPFSWQPATIVDGTSLAFKPIIIRDDHAAFPRSHQFARLKAERSADAEGP